MVTYQKDSRDGLVNVNMVDSTIFWRRLLRMEVQQEKEDNKIGREVAASLRRKKIQTNMIEGKREGWVRQSQR